MTTPHTPAAAKPGGAPRAKAKAQATGTRTATVRPAAQSTKSAQSTQGSQGSQGTQSVQSVPLSAAPSSAPVAMPYRATWLAHPALSVLLALSWLFLSHSLELVHLLSAALLGLIVPRLLHGFLVTLRTPPIHWGAALGLARVVLWDIVLSNITVAKLVLGPLGRMQPAWLPVPLDSDHPHVNGLLAAIITTTPGTVSCVINEQRREILVHALNCDDAQAMIDDMKTRYEAPLMRIFGVHAVASAPVTRRSGAQP